MRERLVHLAERAADHLNLGRAGDLLYVIDRNGWSFYWDGLYITRGLKALGRRAGLVHEPWHRRRRILHFGNRYTYLKGPWQGLHPSNRLFMTWFHGRPDDPNPDMRRLFDLLPPAAARLERVVVSCQAGRQVLESVGIAPERLAVIPLGVDRELFRPAAPGEKAALRQTLGIPEGARVIGSFQKDGEGWGEGTEPKLIKGPDLFLEALAQLKRERDDLYVLLTGPARGYVRRGLERLGIAHQHRRLEDFRQVAELYRALDLYLIASRDEGGPKALLESWASGVPVVATPVGMCPDLIAPGVSGWLAGAEDPAGLARGAGLALGDPATARAWATAALAQVDRYTWDEVAKGYDALYREGQA